MIAMLKTLSCLLLVAGITAQTFVPKIGNSTLLSLDQKYGATYSVQCGKYEYFRIYMFYACRDLVVSVKATQGNPNIYVSKALVDLDPYPTKEKLTWAAFATDTLTISHWDPESAPGYYYIGIYNDCSEQSSSALFQLQALSVETAGSTDILLNPTLSQNQQIVADGYVFYRFCVPECNNVKVTLTNCMDNDVCPGKYSYPELLVSRHVPEPKVKDYTYKLATISRRYVWVNHTDPASRDDNGFLQGTYYVGVYGWCTPQQFVQNNATDGPCAYAALTEFDVSIQLYDGKELKVSIRVRVRVRSSSVLASRDAE
jgi:hypothetical protein